MKCELLYMKNNGIIVRVAKYRGGGGANDREKTIYLP